jgi:phosphatidylinositol dimannoside acyltransferase
MSTGQFLRRHLLPGSAFWRRLAHAGVQYGPEPWVRYSPPLFGLAFWAALPQPRRHVQQTLARLRGHPSVTDDLVGSARVFVNFACSLTDSLLTGSGRRFEPVVHSANDGHDFKTGAAEGKGLILATAHTAGWDVAGPMLKKLQASEVVVVMEEEQDPRARALHDAARENAGVRVIHAGRDPLAALPLLAHLRGGGLVALKFDRTVPGMRVRQTRFLGEPWPVPEGILTLAAVSGAPILPIFTRRLGFMQYEYVTTPAFHVSRRPDDAELDAAAQKLATLLEDFARENPEQWFRWRG